MAALRAAVFPISAKNRRGGHFLPPPPSNARVIDCVVGQECKPTFDICGAGTVNVYWQENFRSKMSIWRAGSV